MSIKRNKTSPLHNFYTQDTFKENQVKVKRTYAEYIYIIMLTTILKEQLQDLGSNSNTHAH